MTFLAPLFLLFALTAAVPVVLHLYRQRRRTMMPFSTNRFFTRAIIRAQRRLRLRRLLLLVLRVAACILIALAVARPLMRSMGLASVYGRRDVVVVLDDSLSMQASDSPRPSRFDQAWRLATQLLRKLGAGDRAAVVTFTGRIMGESLGDDPARLAAAVDALSPSFAAGHADSALARAAAILDRSRGRRPLVILVSDQQASDWSGADWPQPAQPLDLATVRLLEPSRDNLTLQSISISPGRLLVGQPASATVQIVNHGSAPREATLTITCDDAEQSRRKLKLVAGGSQVETIPLQFAEAGVHRIVAMIDVPDTLRADNVLFAGARVDPQLSVLLIDGQSALTGGSIAQKRGSAAFYLRAAMLASAESQSSPAVRPDAVAPERLSDQPLEGYHVLVLSNVRSLASRDWQRVEEFARRGGGVAIFLGDQADAEFYNAALPWMKLESAAATQPFDRPLRVHRVDEQHPMLARLAGESRGAILGLGIYNAQRIDAGSAAVLARMDDDQPLVIERDLGRGRVIVWATAPVPGWTNLPLRRSFIPILGQMLSYLAGDEPPATGVVGRAIDLPAGKSPPGAELQVIRPDGTSATATVLLSGTTTVARLPAEQVSLPGFYQLGDEIAALNAPRSESSPAVLSQADIDRCRGIWNVSKVSGEGELDAILESSPTFAGLWDALLWILLAVLVIEALLATRQSSKGVLSPRTRIAIYALRGVAVACAIAMILHVGWRSTSQRQSRRAIAILLDDSRSMSQAAGGETRYELARRVLERTLPPALRKTHELVVFDVRANRVDAPAKPQAEGASSPLSQTLLKIGRAMRDQALVGIVMLSDGVDTDQRAPPDELTTPVYPIEVAPAGAVEQGDPDLSIAAVSANQRTLAGNTVRVVADVTARGKIDNTAVAVSVFHGDKPVKTKLTTWPAGASSQRVEIEFAPKQAGHLTYGVQVGPIDGEKNPDDNRRFFSIDVRAKPITVLYLDGVLRWEGKFLREALGNDPDLNLVSSIRTLPGTAGSRGLLSGENLAKIDVVILGDIEGSFLSRQEIDALRSWVTERGGGLLVSGGYHSFGPAGLGRTDLRHILPVEFSAAENPQLDQPFNLRLTEIGQEHPIFDFSGDRVRDTRFIQSLPRLDGCSRIAGIKPGAEVLATNASFSGPDGSGLPVMITQQVGAGRTMVFAVDTTWRWRMVVGGFTGDASFYQRFWGQIVRWLARGEDARGKPLLDVSASRAQCQPGQIVEITAMVHQPATHGASPTVWRIGAVALDCAGNPAPIEMSPRPDGSFHGAMKPAQVGRVDVVVSAQPTRVGQGDDDSAPTMQTRAITLQVDRPDPEMIQTAPDPSWLRRLAQQTGGQYLTPDDVAQWADSLPREPVTTTAGSRIELWRHPAMVLFFLSCLCAEWIIRRRSLML